jgi:hypothetical protein
VKGRQEGHDDVGITSAVEELRDQLELRTVHGLVTRASTTIPGI